MTKQNIEVVDAGDLSRMDYNTQDRVVMLNETVSSQPDSYIRVPRSRNGNPNLEIYLPIHMVNTSEHGFDASPQYQIATIFQPGFYQGRLPRFDEQEGDGRGSVLDPFGISGIEGYINVNMQEIEELENKGLIPKMPMNKYNRDMMKRYSNGVHLGGASDDPEELIRNQIEGFIKMYENIGSFNQHTRRLFDQSLKHLD